MLIAAVAALLFLLLVPTFAPVPHIPWYEGVVLATVERLQHGGSAYVGLSNGSLVPAESPYFPASIFITWLASSLVPPSTYWPRILGIAATLFLALEVWITAVRLGASRLAAGMLVTL